MILFFVNSTVQHIKRSLKLFTCCCLARRWLNDAGLLTYRRLVVSRRYVSRARVQDTIHERTVFHSVFIIGTVVLVAVFEPTSQTCELAHPSTTSRTSPGVIPRRLTLRLRQWHVTNHETARAHARKRCGERIRVEVGFNGQGRRATAR